MTRLLIVAGVVLVLGLGAGAAHAGSPPSYRILGATAVHQGRDAAVIVRLDRALPPRGEDRPPLMLGRGLRRGADMPRGQRYYGGATPGRAGRRDRHCYVAEAQQPLPRAALRAGARFTAAIRAGRRILATRSVVLRRGGDAFTRAVLRRAGC
jgi:hypothetical protein